MMQDRHLATDQVILAVRIEIRQIPKFGTQFWRRWAIKKISTVAKYVPVSIARRYIDAAIAYTDVKSLWYIVVACSANLKANPMPKIHVTRSVSADE